MATSRATGTRMATYAQAVESTTSKTRRTAWFISQMTPSKSVAKTMAVSNRETSSPMRSSKNIWIALTSAATSWKPSCPNSRQSRQTRSKQFHERLIHTAVTALSKFSATTSWSTKTWSRGWSKWTQTHASSFLHHTLQDWFLRCSRTPSRSPLTQFIHRRPFQTQKDTKFQMPWTINLS